MKKEFKHGDHVLYIPTHAHGNINHKDCERGVVSSVSNDGKTIFVKYDNKVCVMISGDEPYTAQATNSDDLIQMYNGEKRND